MSSEGQRRLVRLSLSPVHDFGIRTICVVATDMTELAGANEALKSSEETLETFPDACCGSRTKSDGVSRAICTT